MDNLQQNQSQRMKSAFLFLIKCIQEKEVSRAYKFFDNVIKTESSLAREDERKNSKPATAAPGIVEVTPERISSASTK